MTRRGSTSEKAAVVRPDRRLADLSHRRAQRKTWRRKRALRQVYGDLARRLLAASTQGRLLEVGAGIGHLKDVVRPGRRLVSLDVVAFAGIDVTGDAHRLPFRDDSFAGIVMIDTLHHLQRPVRFLREAARIVRPGGRVVMIEPGVTPLSCLFYRAFHREPLDLGADPYADGPLDPERAPFDANQALPTRMIRDDGAAALRAEVPRLRLRRWEWLSLWAYPLSGGFRPWSAIPPPLVGPVLNLERRTLPWLGPWAAFRLLAVLERNRGR